jgi:signal transduction histidine kinase
MTQVDIHKGIDSTLLIINNRLKPKGDNPGIAVVKEYGELPLVKGYAGLLNQVFMNLLCNAVDALEDCPPKLCAQTDFEEHYKAVNGNGSSDNQACALENRSDTSARRLGCISVSDRETLASSPSITPASACTQETHIVPKFCPMASPKVIRICTELIEGEALDGKTTEPRVVIRIIDNGPGMPEDVRSQIFDPFFTTKPVGKGTGLGLSISYQIVIEKHRGQLQCISAPNQGTEFRIEIPIQQ